MPDRRPAEVAEDERTSPNGARTTMPGQDAGAASPAMQRAEELVDRMGERVAHYAALLGTKIKEWAARLREEAEDIWAEAQSIRRGEHPPTDK
jgi:hypothetical protein